MANPPNFRLGRRGTPPGKLNTYRKQVTQHRPPGEREPPDLTYWIDDYSADSDYVED